MTVLSNTAWGFIYFLLFLICVVFYDFHVKYIVINKASYGLNFRGAYAASFVGLERVPARETYGRYDLLKVSFSEQYWRPATRGIWAIVGDGGGVLEA